MSTQTDLDDRYRQDAEQARARRRAAQAEQAAEVEPTRTPSGPITAIAAVVAVVLVVIAGLAMLGPMLQRDVTTERALPAGLTSLRVHSDVGQVRVRAADPGESPHVTRTDRYGLLRPETSIDTSGDTATLRSSCPEIANVCRTQWVVVVPEETTVRIDQGLGATNVEGLAGDVDVRSGVGSVTLTDMTASRVGVDLGVGDLTVEAVEPPRLVDASVGVGDLTVRVPGDVPYAVQTTGQDVSNQLGDDPAAPRRILAETGVGGLTIQPS